MLSNIKSILGFDSKEYPKQFEKIINNLYPDSNPDEEIVKKVHKAFEFGSIAHSEQLRSSGEPYFIHCVSVGVKLSEWCLDSDTIIAGILHDTLEDTDVSIKILESEFNPEIAKLVEGVSKLSGIRFRSREQKQAENFMKMFLSVANDIRVIIIKFADRLHNMKTIEHLPRIKQRRIAKETRDVFAPLAHRLGMYELKIELEDLSLKVINKSVYDNLKKKIDTTRKQRDKYIEKFSSPILQTLDEYSIESKVYGRAKHYYSIYNKMISQNLDFEQLYDLFAIRIIINKIEDCYAVLGIVHQIYKPIQDRFKDYIATPKSNGYQSIHTTVVGIDGKPVEIQIRTYDMDKSAEIGIAAHWNYKEESSIDNSTGIDRHVKWLRELVEVLKSEDKDPEEFLKLLKLDLFKDEIFVFTPDGDLVQLQHGSTPLDFAFKVHSQVGIHCVEAKVNGRIVQLNSELNNGDTVEIQTSKDQKPNVGWLKIVKTAKARYHIKRLVNKEQNEQSIELGKEIAEKAFRRLKRKKLMNEVEKNPSKFGFNSSDMVFSEVASGNITVRDIIDKFDQSDISKKTEFDSESLTERFLNKARGAAKGVVVDGVSNAMIIFAKCCSPIPGDEIIGYITRGRGVTVHRTRCQNLPFIKENDRFINVEWNVSKNRAFVVRLRITAQDRKNLLKDITESISRLNMNIVSIDMRAQDGFGICILILETRDTRQLDRLNKKIIQVQGIIDIERI